MPVYLRWARFTSNDRSPVGVPAAVSLLNYATNGVTQANSGKGSTTSGKRYVSLLRGEVT
jgi:hypothetical protein